jgi:hypothetical protein
MCSIREPSCLPRRFRRLRGSTYLLVLSVATLMTGIGLSALLALRVERRTTDLTSAIAQARTEASSFLAVALLRIQNDPFWRTTYKNNIWEPNETVNETLFTLKLVDEEDSDLGNDPNQPVRLYTKATVDEAVRIYSVLLACEGALGNGNLLLNSNMEAGTGAWLSWNCLHSESLDAYNGTKSLFASGRGSIDATVYQLITNLIEKDKEYYVETWAKTDSGTNYLTVSVRTDGTTSGMQIFNTNSVFIGTEWKKISGTVTPTWAGSLTEARWRTFSYPDGNTGSFYIDDALMRPTVAPPGTVAVIPGTWRREMD